LELVRYILTYNYLPDHLKKTILLTIHKKEDVTELFNYVGIMLTNTLMTLAISYEAALLQEWADKLGLLPSFQMATRPST
jgi:ABC-type multidrug transport system ATPase subunit